MSWKATIAAAVAACTLLGTQNLWAQRAGQFGVGVVAGDPIGPTVKFWLNKTVAIDAAVGFNNGETAFYGDVLFHSLIAHPGDGKLLIYGGAGPRIEDEEDSQWGLRTVGGLSYWLPKAPVELFAELAPTFEFAEFRRDSEWEMNGGIGLRFYFGGSR